MPSRESSLAGGILYTDFYQLTMAQLYFRMGMHELPARFEYFFRTCPDYGMHRAGYCISAGLGWLTEWMKSARAHDGVIRRLRSHTGKSGAPLFSEEFLNWFAQNGNFDGLTLYGMAEGRVVHPELPVIVSQGPLAMTQILESPLLNYMNYQTLIATKASRIKRAGAHNLTIEFGMRRAQATASNAGARAALIGGVDFTSNTGISYELGVPPKGTHAHSMIQAFLSLGQTELDAFRAYADLYPDDCILLVDTIDVLKSGLPNAITVFEELRGRGHTPAGIRLDSGDLVYQIIQSVRLLDKAGFDNVPIVLSNQLDEFVLLNLISELKNDCHAAGLDPHSVINRLTYGVGTRLITSWGAASLDGVYKLTALQRNGEWAPALKLSENPDKILNPGSKRVWRLYDAQSKAIGDCLSLPDEDIGSYSHLELYPTRDNDRRVNIDAGDISEIEPVHETLFENGATSTPADWLDSARKLRVTDERRLKDEIVHLTNPHTYPVYLTRKLRDYKREQIASVVSENTH
ncbi:MAG: nicotinate phosphoribosyltransferase [Chitinivibrionales bacterium]|nr:nicotinate phosphoribosyltransferase [Chitinivibrionales bacterium]